MSDALLPYYDRELKAIRQLAGEFAQQYPKIAGRLRLSEDKTDDPHVERLLEGAAFLAARVHHRLDDEFPELTDALLNLLYPHYLAPTPSCMIAQFGCRPDVLLPARLATGAEVETEPVHGEACRYRTTSDLTLWPIEIEDIRLTGQPLVAPANPQARGAASVLRITLRCAAPDVTFAQLGVDRLRFFLRDPANQALPLYELLAAHTISVAYADGPTDPAPVIRPAASLHPAGFEPEDALLPWPARGFTGFRLLTEYFAFPEKFLFLDFTGIDAKTLASGGARLEIFVYLDRALPDLERAVGAHALALGCVPLVNLFAARCEPINLNHTDTEYRVVPDVRSPLGKEVWSVRRVLEGQPDGSMRVWRPFHRLAETEDEQEEPGGFYHVARRPAAPGMPGSEVFLALHDPAFDPDQPSDARLSVDALCLNRDLPADLPFGVGQRQLRLVRGAAAVSEVICLTAPTPTLRRPLRESSSWRLVSHLSLGHLSITGGRDGAAALKEVLRLYDLRESAESRAAIDGLIGISAAPGTARAPGRAAAFCRGLDVTLEFDARVWQAGGLYLLAAVLERFLALHGTINSFVRTRAVLRGRPGVAAAWPARSGTRTLA
jgi:type VI secretion system protein ImpG